MDPDCSWETMKNVDEPWELHSYGPVSGQMVTLNLNARAEDLTFVQATHVGERPDSDLKRNRKPV